MKLILFFSQEHQCSSYENGIWINTASPIRYGNNAFLRPDGKVQTMGGFGDVNDVDSTETSDVVTLEVGSIPGFGLTNMTK